MTAAGLRRLGPFDVPGFPSPRWVRVHVPAAAPPPGQRPALYLFDGQNVFDDHGSFAGGWWAHEAVDRLRGRRAPPPLVVGIDHGGTRRIDELSPWAVGAHGGGQADRFLEWVVGVVVPAVRRELGAVAGPHGAVVGGSSMGGLAALYAHLRHPEVFGGALCMSPSVWVADRAIAGVVERTPRPFTSRIYLDCGAREGGGRMLPAVAELASALAQRGYGPRELMWRPDARGGHSERHWRRRLPKALRFHFAPPVRGRR